MEHDMRIEILRTTHWLPKGDRDPDRHLCYAYSIELVKGADGATRLALQHYTQEDHFHTSIRDGNKVRRDAIQYASAVAKMLACGVALIDVQLKEVKKTEVFYEPLEFTPVELEFLQSS